MPENTIFGNMNTKQILLSAFPQSKEENIELSDWLVGLTGL